MFHSLVSSSRLSTDNLFPVLTKDQESSISTKARGFPDNYRQPKPQLSHLNLKESPHQERYGPS
jgi:hypothetical protein